MEIFVSGTTEYDHGDHSITVPLNDLPRRKFYLLAIVIFRYKEERTNSKKRADGIARKPFQRKQRPQQIFLFDFQNDNEMAFKESNG